HGVQLCGGPGHDQRAPRGKDAERLTQDRLGFGKMLQDRQHHDIVELGAPQRQSFRYVRSNERNVAAMGGEWLIVQPHAKLNPGTAISKEIPFVAAPDIAHPSAALDVRQGCAEPEPRHKVVERSVISHLSQAVRVSDIDAVEGLLARTFKTHSLPNPSTPRKKLERITSHPSTRELPAGMMIRMTRVGTRGPNPCISHAFTP